MPKATPKLKPFESRDVLQASMRITRAGDGLSTALTIDPVELHIGDTLFVLLECQVGAIELRPIKDTEVLVRKHTLVAGVGTVVTAEWAGEAIAEQRRLNLEAAGVHELPLDDGATD
jgi:hypothetical protein